MTKKECLLEISSIDNEVPKTIWLSNKQLTIIVGLILIHTIPFCVLISNSMIIEHAIPQHNFFPVIMPPSFIQQTIDSMETDYKYPVQVFNDKQTKKSFQAEIRAIADISVFEFINQPILSLLAYGLMPVPVMEHILENSPEIRKKQRIKYLILKADDRKLKHNFYSIAVPASFIPVMNNSFDPDFICPVQQFRDTITNTLFNAEIHTVVPLTIDQYIAQSSLGLMSYGFHSKTIAIELQRKYPEILKSNKLHFVVLKSL